MTDFMVNTHMLAFSFIMLGTLVLVIAVWRYLDKRLTDRGEREVEAAFGVHRDISGRPRQEWDGETWPHQVQDYQNDPWLYSQPPYVPQRLADTRVEVRSPRFIPTQVMPAIAAAARPSCPASGPMPGLDASLETDAFIASMRAETDRWISYYSMAELAGV